VHTPAGEYDGYRVIRPCPIGLPGLYRIGIRGTGSACFGGACDVSSKESSRASDEFLERLEAGFPPGSLQVGSCGAVCEEPWPRNCDLDVDVYDPRIADAVIRRIGALLKQDGLGEEAVIQVFQGPVHLEMY
jgi:hypothetical protein